MLERSPQQHGRRWKRTVVVALLLLVGGAIVNIAVAWWIALGGSYDNPSEKATIAATVAERAWHVEVRTYSSNRRVTAWLRLPHDASVEQVIAVSADEDKNRRSIRRLPSSSFAQQCFETDDDLVQVIVLQQGWPCRAMFCALSAPWRDYGHEAVLSGYYTGKYHDNALGWPPRLLPLRPLWPGFIINTLFYGAILWPLFAIPFAARRALRRRRGLCTKCAYPIGTSAVCTECGAAVASRPVCADPLQS